MSAGAAGAAEPSRPDGFPSPPRLPASLSEDRILETIHEVLRCEQGEPEGTAVMLGPGDDAAVLDLTSGASVLSIDTQTEGQDYHLQWPSGYQTRPFELGWKSAAQNLADIAAMGARPVALLVSLTLTSRQDLAFIAEMTRGYAVACRELGAVGCRIVGGDLGRGGELSATVTAIGIASQGTQTGLLHRDGARPGDRLVLVGSVGRAAAGLDLLMYGDCREWGPVPAEGTAHVCGADPEALAASQLRPCPPVGRAEHLVRAGAQAGLDVSDGLIRDAGRMARASGVRIDLDPVAVDALTTDLQRAGRMLGRDPREWVLAGGEDHGLLLAMPVDFPLPEGARAIGSCAEADASGPAVTLAGQAPENTLGWDHFAHDEDRFERGGDETLAGGLRWRPAGE